MCKEPASPAAKSQVCEPPAPDLDARLFARLDALGLPAWLRRALEHPPARGEGLHPWLFSTAMQLHAHLVADDMLALLEHLCPEAEERELRDAVANSEPVAWQPRHSWQKERLNLPGLRRCAPEPDRPPARATAQPPRGRPPRATHQPKWPLPDAKRIREIVAAGAGLAGLRAQSAYRFGGDARWTRWLLRRLFPADSLLCLALAQREFWTLPLAKWLAIPALWQMQFIVPSPMTARYGHTLDGHESARCLGNTGPRRYLVIEFDTGAPDEHASLLMHLAKLLPLAMAVFSGGKSLHGWFFVQRQPEADLRLFLRQAASLGADLATYSPCQLVRLPDGTRQDKDGGMGARQTVEFFNPEEIQ